MGDIIYISWLVTIIAIIALGFVPSKLKSIVTIVTVLTSVLLTSWLAFPALSGNAVEFMLSLIHI